MLWLDKKVKGIGTEKITNLCRAQLTGFAEHQTEVLEISKNVIYEKFLIRGEVFAIQGTIRVELAAEFMVEFLKNKYK